MKQSKESTHGSEAVRREHPLRFWRSDLRELFGKIGSVESVSIPVDMATGRPRGFAFVEMGADEEAAKAITELNQTEFQGRRLTVNEARPRTARPPRDPGFDGGRREPRW